MFREIKEFLIIFKHQKKMHIMQYYDFTELVFTFLSVCMILNVSVT